MPIANKQFRAMERLAERAVAGLALLIVGAVTIALGGPAAAAPSPLDTTLADAWTRTEDGPQRYTGVHIDWDVPIRMSDGIILKANVYRPMDAAGHVITAPVPTIINMTPYTKLIYMLLESATAIPGLYDPIVDLMNRFDLFDLAGTPISAIGDQIRAISSGSARTISADPQLIKSPEATPGHRRCSRHRILAGRLER